MIPTFNECHLGPCLDLMRSWPNGIAQTCVTSPPYWGLRDYGVDGQDGLEKTPEEFTAKMVAVFSEVHRLLRDDGTLWLNLGDSYAGAPGGFQGKNGQRGSGTHTARIDLQKKVAGLKSKDLVGIPWRVAFALQTAGWYLRSDIIWHKPNPMPEAVTDRPTKAHEYIFLLTKSASYYYDADAIREPLAEKTFTTFGTTRTPKGNDPLGKVKSDNFSNSVPLRLPKRMPDGSIAGANKRSVWTVATRPYDGTHFATFPPPLIIPCILAGSRPGDVVLDPYFGSGTTGQVAQQLGRRWIGCELNPKYFPLQDRRTQKQGMAL